MKRLTKIYKTHISAICENCERNQEFCDAEDCLSVFRKRLADYENTGMTPEEVIDLQQAWDMYGGEEGITAVLDELERLRKEPPNDPLTLEELREMDGEPVYIVDFECSDLTGWHTWHNLDSTALYGYTWLSYRRKPEEGRYE